MELSFFADENIGEELIEWLKFNNYKVSSVKNENLSGISDERIINKCYREKQIIITHDNDFGKFIYTKNISFFALIYLRPADLTGDLHIPSMQKILQNSSLIQPGSLIVSRIKSNKIKIRFRQITQL
jgi:predicted nuclease of predicted toxin-antitoxin system